MSQASIVVANGTGLAVRGKINDALMAVTTGQSGTNPPNPTYPYMEWVDTSTSPATIRRRNAADTAWITLGTLTASTYSAAHAAASDTATSAGDADTLDGKHANEITAAYPAAGSVINYGRAESSSAFNCSGSVIPIDNTIPQNTEGVQVLSLPFAAKRSNSKLLITATLHGQSQSLAAQVAAIFQSGSAGAIAAAYWVENHTASNVDGNTITLTKEFSPGSTASITYSVRVSGGSINPAVFGGAQTSSITIMEVAQ